MYLDGGPADTGVRHLWVEGSWNQTYCGNYAQRDLDAWGLGGNRACKNCARKLESLLKDLNRVSA